MTLHIAPNRLISEIQETFNAWFPFLKIEFFHNRVYQQPDFSSLKMIPRHRKVAEGQIAITDGDVEIKPGMSVKELEKIFIDQFSLAVQVFRRSGNIWLETTITDDWTLEQQNEHGRELSTEAIKKKFPEQEDYDLTRGSDH